MEEYESPAERSGSPDPEAGLPKKKLDLQRSGSSSAPQTRSGTPISFEFVNNSDKSTIRSHAMRASWRQRAMASSSRGRVRDSAARDQTQRRALLSTDHVQESGSSSPEEVDIEVEDEQVSEKPPFLKDTVYLDHRHTLMKPARMSTTRRKWKLSTLPQHRGQRSTPYQSIGDAEINSFNTIRLSHEDQVLLHHCKH